MVCEVDNDEGNAGTTGMNINDYCARLGSILGPRGA